MTTRLRPATPADASFLGRVMLLASRSHVARGAWDIMFDGTDDEVIGLLARMARADARSWCQWAGFVIAEVDGRPAAALSRFDRTEVGLLDPGDVAVQVLKAAGWTPERLAAALVRLKPFLTCIPPQNEGTWLVEWVATLPEYRRRGLVRLLLDEALALGRSEKHELAQLMILIGNDTAQRAYERVGFAVTQEWRTSEFEAAVGCPGLARMLRKL